VEGGDVEDEDVEEGNNVNPPIPGVEIEATDAHVHNYEVAVEVAVDNLLVDANQPETTLIMGMRLDSTMCICRLIAKALVQPRDP
jgi:hypothetical protein